SCTLALLTLACTPYALDLDDSIPPEAQDDPTIEALEPIYAFLPDDDRETPVEPAQTDRRCAPDAGTPVQPFGLPDPIAAPETGMLAVERGGKLLALPLRETTFDTVVVGTVAETTITQVFANPFDAPIEAVYM